MDYRFLSSRIPISSPPSPSSQASSSVQAGRLSLPTLSLLMPSPTRFRRLDLGQASASLPLSPHYRPPLRTDEDRVRLRSETETPFLRWILSPAPSPLRTDEDRVRLRSEAEAPFRALRFGLFGFGIISAGVSLLVSLPQVRGKAGRD